MPHVKGEEELSAGLNRFWSIVESGLEQQFAQFKIDPPNNNCSSNYNFLFLLPFLALTLVCC